MFLVNPRMISTAGGYPWLSVNAYNPWALLGTEGVTVAFADDGIAALARIAAETGREERAGLLWGAIEAEEERSRMGAWAKERDRLGAPVLVYAGPKEYDRLRAYGLDDTIDFGSFLIPQNWTGGRPLLPMAGMVAVAAQVAPPSVLL